MKDKICPCQYTLSYLLKYEILKKKIKGFKFPFNNNITSFSTKNTILIKTCFF